MSEPSTVAEAAISCRQSLQKCVSLMKDGWAENRLIDFNLWSAGSGACAEGRTSLDDRLLLKPDIRDVLINLLLMLRIFAENCRELGESRISGQTLSTAVAEPEAAAVYSLRQMHDTYTLSPDDN